MRPELYLIQKIKPIIIVWFLYLILLSLLSLLPHREGSLIHWINISISFFVCLMSFAIYKQNGNPKLFFLLLGIFYAFHSSFIISAFLGSSGVWGTDTQSWIYYQSWLIIGDFLLGISLVYLVTQIIFKNTNTWKIFLTSVIIMAVVIFIFYNKIILNSRYIIEVQDATYLYWSSIKVHFFWFAFILIYWIKYLPKDRPYTQYINSILFVFSLFIILDLLHVASFLLKFDLASNFSQYWNVGVAILFGIVLVLKFNSVITEFGQWYEHTLFTKSLYFGRRRGAFDRVIHWLLFSKEKNKR